MKTHTVTDCSDNDCSVPIGGCCIHFELYKGLSILSYEIMSLIITNPVRHSFSVMSFFLILVMLRAF